METLRCKERREKCDRQEAGKAIILMAIVSIRGAKLVQVNCAPNLMNQTKPGRGEPQYRGARTQRRTHQHCDTTISSGDFVMTSSLISYANLSSAHQSAGLKVESLLREPARRESAGCTTRARTV